MNVKVSLCTSFPWSFSIFPSIILERHSMKLNMLVFGYLYITYRSMFLFLNFM